MLTIFITAIVSGCIGVLIATVRAGSFINAQQHRIALLEELYIAACQPEPARDATVAQWVENNKAFNEKLKRKLN